MRRLAAATHRSKLRKSMGTLISVEGPRACRTRCHSRSLGSSCSCSHRRRRSHSGRRLQLSKSAHRPCSSVSWRTPLARADVGHPSRWCCAAVSSTASVPLSSRTQAGGRYCIACAFQPAPRSPHRVPLSVSPSLSLSGRRSTTSPTRCVCPPLSLSHTLSRKSGQLPYPQIGFALERPGEHPAHANPTSLCCIASH